MNSAIPEKLTAGMSGQPGQPSWNVACCFPLQGEWSEEDYLALDRSGNRMIVDPAEQEIQVLVLDGITYRRHARIAIDEMADSVLLNGFSVRVRDVLSAGGKIEV